jgi:hypothetical protein
MPERPRAIPFIVPELCSNGLRRFSVAPGALSLLRSFDIPVAPVAVAGRFRSGKSYLLNVLVGSDPHAASSGFEVGPTVEACTRGLWLWSAPTIVTAPSGGKVAVLWVDTEGLGSNDAEPQHDARIFSFATLLCSLLIYNSVGSIDEEAIAQLAFVAQLSRHIETQQIRREGEDSDAEEEGRGGEGDAIRDQFFPTLLWTIRDFSLALEDPEDGSPITAREYLETALAPRPGYASDVLARNRTRRALTTFFKRRECVTLVRPMDEEAALTRLDSTPWASLRPAFRSGMTDLRARVLGELALPKTANGVPVTGRVLAGLALSFCTAINAGGVPSIRGAWEASTAAESDAALVEARAALDGGIVRDAHAGLLPMDEDVLMRVHEKVADAALAVYDARAVGPAAPTLRTQLAGRIATSWARLREENGTASDAACARQAARCWALHVESALEAPEPGGADGAGARAAALDSDAVAAACTAFKSAYLAIARGPAVHKALAVAALEGVLPLTRASAAAAGVAAAVRVMALEAQLASTREALETAAARAEVYERQCADLRMERTANAVGRARAEAEQKAAASEVSRLVQRLSEADAEVAACEARLSVESKEHAATRVALRAANGGAPQAPGGGSGGPLARQPSAAAVLAASAGVRGGSVESAPDTRVDPRVDSKFKQRLAPIGLQLGSEFPPEPAVACGPGCTLQ